MAHVEYNGPEEALLGIGDKLGLDAKVISGMVDAAMKEHGMAAKADVSPTQITIKAGDSSGSKAASAGSKSASSGSKAVAKSSTLQRSSSKPGKRGPRRNRSPSPEPKKTVKTDSRSSPDPEDSRTGKKRYREKW